MDEGWMRVMHKETQRVASRRLKPSNLCGNEQLSGKECAQTSSVETKTSYALDDIMPQDDH